MSPSKYVWEAIGIHKEYVNKNLAKSYRMQKKADTPFCLSYCPELYMSPVFEFLESS